MKYLPIIIALAVGASAVSCSEETEVSTKIPIELKPQPGEEDDDNADFVQPNPTFPCNSFQVTVDPNTAYQTMEGFGASDCWLGDPIGRYWGTMRSEIASLLFSRRIIKGQPEGIGLSMWRVNLGAGSAEQGDDSGISGVNSRAESFFYGGAYDWNKCAGQRYFMEQAKNFGCESFVLFSNSPLVQWTLNGQARSDNGYNANLKAENYGDFANYMATVAEHFVKDGYNISHISPVNEPQNNWAGNAQEGSGWRNGEIAKITTELSKALSGRGLSTQVLIAEAGAWDHVYQGNQNEASGQAEAFFNPSSPHYVGALSNVDKNICGHSYWTFDNWNLMRDVRKRVGEAAKARGLKVWQTEWSMLDACPSELGGSYNSLSEFDIAAYMSKIIHLDIVDANCSSWSYWTALSVDRYDQKNRFELIKTTAAGGQYSDDFSSPGTVEATHNLWVLGNYSLFVRPGYRRVDISLGTEETNRFFATAYVSPDRNTLVVVYSNFDNIKGAMVPANLGLPGEPKSISTYTTTVKKHLQRARFKNIDKVFVDPYSITTVVYQY